MKRAFEMGELDAIAGEGGNDVNKTATPIAREVVLLGRVGLLTELHLTQIGCVTSLFFPTTLRHRAVEPGSAERTPPAVAGSCPISVVAPGLPPMVVGSELDDVREDGSRRPVDEYLVGIVTTVSSSRRSTINVGVRLRLVVHVYPASVAVSGELVPFEAVSVVARIVVLIRRRHRWNSRRVVCAVALGGADKQSRDEYD